MSEPRTPDGSLACVITWEPGARDAAGIVAMVREAFDHDGTLGAVQDRWFTPGTEYRGYVAGPPCAHVPATGGRYRAYNGMSGAQLLVDGRMHRSSVHFGGCEHCMRMVSVSTPEDGVRHGWRLAHGRPTLPASDRPWRESSRVADELRSLADRILQAAPGGTAQVTWR